MERRQELRLSLKNLTINFKGQLFNVKDISLSGLRLNNFDFRFGVHRAILFYNKEYTEIIFKIVNISIDNSVGCIILNKEDCNDFLESLFSPHVLSAISTDEHEVNFNYINTNTNTNYSFTAINNKIYHLNVFGRCSEEFSFPLSEKDNERLKKIFHEDDLHNFLTFH